MFKQSLKPLLAIIFFFSPPLLAQDGARVTGLISPAWVVQETGRTALSPGYRVQPGDRIETDTGGRVQMAFSNDAEFQLGAEAEFRSHQLEAGATQDEAYQGFVEVFKGAFRYIGEVFGPGPQNSSFSVKVGYSTIGLRGTDFWGVTDRTTDTIVLIEGAITVTPDSGQPFTMDTPQTIVQNVVGSGPGAIGTVNAETLGRSAAETRLTRGMGVLTEDGRYQVVLGSLESERRAMGLSQRIDTQGYPATVEYAPEINRYRVLVSGLDSREDAKFFAKNTATNLGVPDAWIRISRSSL